MINDLLKWIKDPANMIAAALVLISAAVIIGVSVNAPAPERSDVTHCTTR